MIIRPQLKAALYDFGPVCKWDLNRLGFLDRLDLVGVATGELRPPGRSSRSYSETPPVFAVGMTSIDFQEEGAVPT